MNKEAYRCLDKEEIITKDHYWYHWQNNTFVLLPPNDPLIDDPLIGKKADGRSIYEKVSLEDLRPLNNDEIVNEEHFFVWRSTFGHLGMCRAYLFIGYKADDARKANSSFREYNIYAKKKT
jgi:hypothetical protein